MSSDLDKTVKRMKVSLKATEQPTTPGHGFTLNTRCWRVILSRDTGGEKPIKLTLTVLSAEEPTVSYIVNCLNKDIADSELTLWEFAQEHNDGNTNEPTETMYKTCKRMAARVKRFFGESWVKVAAKAA